VKIITGMHFGRLTVVEKCGSDRHGNPMWHCLCNCGIEINVRAFSLSSGRTASCGCSRNEKSKARIGSVHPVWKGESAARSTKHSWMYRHFGAPSKCEHCNSETEKHYEWANVSGLYIRDRSDWKRLCTRCHWYFDAHIHTRTNPRYEFNGESLLLTEWARKLGIKVQTLSSRIFNYKWPIEKALTMPVEFRRSQVKSCV
jgi:hypothetical protein